MDTTEMRHAQWVDILYNGHERNATWSMGGHASDGHARNETCSKMGMSKTRHN